MGRTALGILAALSLSACATMSPPIVRISDFRQGLVTISAAGEPKIAEEGEAFQYAVNGTCNASGRRLPCMWHGFEFTYEGPDEVNVLTCTVDSSAPYTAVDPKQTYGSNVTTFNFPLKLKGRKGHFINPQYLIWRDGWNAPMHSVTRCEYGEEEVLRFKFTIEAPPNKALQPTASLRSAAAERRR